MARRRKKKSQRSFRGNQQDNVDTPSTSSDEEESSGVSESEKDDIPWQNQFFAEFLEEFKKIRQSFEGKKPGSQEHLLDNILQLFKMNIKVGMQQCQRLTRINDELRTQNGFLAARIEDLERCQINSSKNGILIRNVVPLKSESKENLTNWIEEKLSKILKVPKNEIIHVERFNQRKTNQKESAANITSKRNGSSRPGIYSASHGGPTRGPSAHCAPVLVKFSSVAQKFACFKNLKNLPKHNDTKAWMVLEEVPRCRQQEKKKLEELAFARRKSQPGLKTRICWDHYQLVLEEKRKNASGFSRVNA